MPIQQKKNQETFKAKKWRFTTYIQWILKIFLCKFSTRFEIYVQISHICENDDLFGVTHYQMEN